MLVTVLTILVTNIFYNNISVWRQHPKNVIKILILSLTLKNCHQLKSHQHHCSPNNFRQCRSDHSFYPEPALCTLRESLEGMSFNPSAAEVQLISRWSNNKTQKVDSDYEEWKEKIRIIITSFSAAAAG